MHFLHIKLFTRPIHYAYCYISVIFDIDDLSPPVQEPHLHNRQNNNGKSVDSGLRDVIDHNYQTAIAYVVCYAI